MRDNKEASRLYLEACLFVIYRVSTPLMLYGRVQLSRRWSCGKYRGRIVTCLSVPKIHMIDELRAAFDLAAQPSEQEQVAIAARINMMIEADQ